MLAELGAWAHDHRDALYALLDRWFADGRPLLLQSDLEKEFERLRNDYDKADLEATPLAAFVRHAQEAILQPPWATLAVRERVGHWHYVRIHLERLEPETIGVAEFLRIKESLAAPDAPPDQLLEIDSARSTGASRGSASPVPSDRASPS